MGVESKQAWPWLLRHVLWSRAFDQVAGCFLSWLPLQAIYQLSCYCLGQRVAINAPATSHTHRLPPAPQVGQVLCCKNTVGRLKHTANDRHHEAIKVMGLGGGWQEGRGAASTQLPWRWWQELSEN